MRDRSFFFLRLMKMNRLKDNAVIVFFCVCLFLALGYSVVFS